MERCNGKLVVSFLTGATIGATIGAGLGILFAPYKGSKTRRKIKRSVSDTTQNVSEFVKDAKDALI